MAAFDFPSSPNNGDTYSANGIDWIYNGSVWKKDATAGVKGQKGEIGVTGDKGQKGEKGEVGPQGDKGQKGEIGATGGTGGSGAKGQKGEVGATGSGGSTGQKGEVGATGSGGSTGSTGDKGQKGEVGAQGSQGSTGSTGSAGSDGDKGQKGATGSTGATGSAASYTVKQVLSTSTNATQYYRYYQGPIDTGLSLTINCADANNKILIQYTVNAGFGDGNFTMGTQPVASRLLRNNSQIAGGSGGSSGNESVYVNDTGHGMNSHAFSYLDTPGAGNHTYKVQVRHHESGSYSNYLTVNRSYNGNYRSLSTLTCSEIEI